MVSYPNDNCDGTGTATLLQDIEGCTDYQGLALQFSCSSHDDDMSTASPTASTGNNGVTVPTPTSTGNNGMTVPTPTSTGSDGGDGDGDDEDEDEADAAEALALDVGPLGCLALHSAAGCAASTELQESCSCVSKSPRVLVFCCTA